MQRPETPNKFPGDIDDELEIVPPGTGSFEKSDFGLRHGIFRFIHSSRMTQSGEVGGSKDTPDFRVGKFLSTMRGQINSLLRPMSFCRPFLGVCRSAVAILLILLFTGVLGFADAISGDAELGLRPDFQRSVAPGRSIVPVLDCYGIERRLPAFLGGASPTLFSTLVAAA